MAPSDSVDTTGPGWSMAASDLVDTTGPGLSIAASVETPISTSHDWVSESKKVKVNKS